MPSLSGARVALLDGRMSAEMENLIRRYGGEPFSAPAVRETPVECGEVVGRFIDSLAARKFSTVVLLTGAGVTALFAEAAKLGREHELRQGLSYVTTACRGPKPSAALRRQGVHVSLSAPAPHTTTELLSAMSELDLTGEGVALVHYGEPNIPLAEALRARGAVLEELCLYEWLLPEDTAPLRNLVEELVAGRVDAVTFTSQVQARHLFEVAGELGLAAELVDALNRKVVVASVAPTCASYLRSLGVTPHVVPEYSKMGHLVRALAEHMEAAGSPGALRARL